MTEHQQADTWDRARRWFGDRTIAQIVAELCQGAAEGAPAERVTAVGLIGELGDEAVAAFHAPEQVPALYAHVRLTAHQHELAEAPGSGCSIM